MHLQGRVQSELAALLIGGDSFYGLEPCSLCSKKKYLADNNVLAVSQASYEEQNIFTRIMANFPGRQ